MPGTETNDTSGRVVYGPLFTRRAGSKAWSFPPKPMADVRAKFEKTVAGVRTWRTLEDLWADGVITRDWFCPMEFPVDVSTLPPESLRPAPPTKSGSLTGMLGALVAHCELARLRQRPERVQPGGAGGARPPQHL